ncbi:BURP domain-containing protein [Rhynchospora pubera]|uniref:BURP domain-containing protein n=1 Tax=Rhynchospora pubera TaxID=906938 RepID=A0AAV8CBH7_9POAL|nr:BURP domain-containing protein [Rhynchospora pubera]KAJ4818618.1 BURP domain-containing protein [Rhynchospora pubera]
MTPLVVFLSIAMIFTSGRADHLIWNEWHAMLPNTRMPDIIKDLIKTDENGHMTATKFPNHFDVRAQLAAYFNNWPPEDNAEAVKNLFLKKDMNPGAQTKKVRLARTITGTTFLPRKEADRIPFSSAKLAQILDHLAIVPGSTAEKHVEKTLRDCETPAFKGERKFCATSLESMIEFVTSELGNDVKVTTTGHVKDEQQEATYKIAAEGKEMPGDKLVVCHPQPYPYTIYYCHVNKATKAYVVPLVSKDGEMVNTGTVCHFDTSAWNSFFFEMLNVKPGTKPICHFVPQDHLLWTPSK